MYKLAPLCTGIAGMVAGSAGVPPTGLGTVHVTVRFVGVYEETLFTYLGSARVGV
jgi:hypothetical protein